MHHNPGMYSLWDNLWRKLKCFVYMTHRLLHSMIFFSTVFSSEVLYTNEIVMLGQCRRRQELNFFFLEEGIHSMTMD